MSKPSARDAILDTAERLFAERGLEAVSLRSINTAAGYSVAALHYHFGTREKLIEALVERSQSLVLARREELLSALADEHQLDIHRITDALVLPLAEPIFADPVRGLRTVKLFFQLYATGAKEHAVGTITGQSFRIFDQLLARALPELAAEVLHRRWVIATILTFQGLANMDHFLAGRKRPRVADYRRYTRDLVDFIAGGLAAPERGG